MAPVFVLSRSAVTSEQHFSPPPPFWNLLTCFDQGLRCLQRSLLWGYFCLSSVLWRRATCNINKLRLKPSRGGFSAQMGKALATTTIATPCNRDPGRFTKTPTDAVSAAKCTTLWKWIWNDYCECNYHRTICGSFVRTMWGLLCRCWEVGFYWNVGG